MDGEDPLDAHPVGGLAHREGLPATTSASTEHGALEHLDALLVALDHADVDAHGITRFEGGKALAELFRLDAVDRGHEYLDVLSAAAQTVKDDGRGGANREVVPPVAAADRLQDVVGPAEELAGEPPAGPQDEQLGAGLDGEALTEGSEGHAWSSLAGGRRDEPRQHTYLAL